MTCPCLADLYCCGCGSPALATRDGHRLHLVCDPTDSLQAPGPVAPAAPGPANPPLTAEQVDELNKRAEAEDIPF